MRRFFMMLLLFALAVPAAAQPDCAPPAPSAAAMGHGDHHQQPQQNRCDDTALHGCVGCAAPTRTVPAAPASTIAISKTRFVPSRDAWPHGVAGLPETPPPRPTA
jgi:hypothetical protein